MDCPKCSCLSIKKGRRVYSNSLQVQRFRCEKGHWFETEMIVPLPE